MVSGVYSHKEETFDKPSREIFVDYMKLLAFRNLSDLYILAEGIGRIILAPVFADYLDIRAEIPMKAIIFLLAVI